MKHVRHGGALLVLDYWEKLAGASLALSAIIRLCQRTTFSLVAPYVLSSLFVPGRSATSGAQALELSAYYNVSALREALRPRRLLDIGTWQILLRHLPIPACLLVVIYDDFPSSCTAPMARRAPMDSWCPPPCLALGGVRRLLAAAATWVNSTTTGLPARCILGAELRMAIQTGTGRAAEVFRTHTAVALLNFRRHDEGRPMLPQPEAHALRALAVQPSPSVRSAARRFLTRHQLPLRAYAAVQLRSNHLAQAAYAASTRQLARGGAGGGGGATGGGARGGGRGSAGGADTAGVGGPPCRERVLACMQKLSRAARRLALPSATVVASDVPTLHQANQDGATHRRKSYVRECLSPALPDLHAWYRATGKGLNCTRRRRRGPAAPVSEAERTCDAGWLGLVDLVLATDAVSFVALDSGVWRSAFLEWIVQLRTRAGVRSELIKCA
jgi:uncharacterized membrane protein YgcG